MLRDAVGEAARFGSDIGGQVGKKLFEFRDVGQAVATALGLNLVSIAENVARMVTGMSKEEEKAFNDLAAVSDRVAEASLRNMRATLTAEQRYQLALQERDRLVRSISENEGRTAKDLLRQKQDELKLEEQRAAIQDFEIKRRDELLKKADEYQKRIVAAAEAEYQATLQTLSATDRIASLKETIAAAQAVLASNALDEENRARIIVQLEERKKTLLQEQTKLKQEAAKIDEANAAAVAASVQKQVEAQRETLSFTEQAKAARLEIADLEARIADAIVAGADATEDIRALDAARVTLKNVQGKQAEAQVEAAKLLLKGTDSLTESERARLEVLTGQVTAAERAKEIQTLSASLIAGNITPAERERLGVLLDQSAVIQEQIEKLKEVRAAIVTIQRRGSSYEDQTTLSLEGVQARLKKQLDDARQRNAGTTFANKDPMTYALESEYANVSKELQMRSQVGNYAARFGEDAARRQFGDTLTDRALRDMTDATTRSQQLLQQIENRLAASPLFKL